MKRIALVVLTLVLTLGGLVATTLPAHASHPYDGQRGMKVYVKGKYAVKLDDSNQKPVIVKPGHYARLDAKGRRARVPLGYCVRVGIINRKTVCNYYNHRADLWNEFGWAYCCTNVVRYKAPWYSG